MFNGARSTEATNRVVGRIGCGDTSSAGNSSLPPPAAAGPTMLSAAYTRKPVGVTRAALKSSSDGTSRPYRVRVRPPCLINLQALRQMCVGHLVADVVAIIGTLDIVLGEIDR